MKSDRRPASICICRRKRLLHAQLARKRSLFYDLRICLKKTIEDWEPETCDDFTNHTSCNSPFDLCASKWLLRVSQQCCITNRKCFDIINFEHRLFHRHSSFYDYRRSACETHFLLRLEIVAAF
ncbi:hypothetical protein L596_025550 [Steinernema carpocapsae]|uniref:Uncharacterized protein n=1 Tax=Steinernema carpocapsae TaxID=34508 RepID=A0A4U5M839_STECR|nr:hypothetical protein L596_025550 [Steinernema carpocapsae]